MISIRNLAAQLDTTEDAVRAFVDQLIDIDGRDAIIAHEAPLTNSSGRVIGVETTLTDDAAKAVGLAFRSAEQNGSDEQPLAAVTEAADELRRAEEIVTQYQDIRDEMTRRALTAGVSAQAIAKAAGLHVQRVYQIRDARR